MSEKSQVTERRHFEEGGANYARHRPTYPPELAASLADDCNATSHALDAGCGTGQLSILLTDYFDRVTATDPSKTQIANAKTHPRVTYRVEAAEQICLPDRSVDLVVAAQAAHWFDLKRFYAEAQRVARPCATLALVSYGVPKLSGPAGSRFDDFYWQDIHRYWPAGREHVEQEYSSLSFPFPERALAPHVIERTWSLSELTGYIRTWSATRRAVESGESELVNRGLAEIERIWGDSANTHHISWPIIGRLTTFK
jgi:SAM-dependent methyltransferase